MYKLNEKSTFVCSIVFNCIPDLKAGISGALLATSDSSQALLAKRSSSTRLSEDSLPDLHSDEKNILRRNGSSAGLKMFKKHEVINSSRFSCRPLCVAMAQWQSSGCSKMEAVVPIPAN
uniref:Ovule protein n=1 Tax=Heterorhabditis bacteriophora TaxID=37862 RepID=A0A1I7WRA3_HETBA